MSNPMEPINVPVWYAAEWTLTAREPYMNGYLDVDIKVHMTSPSGCLYEGEAFWNGEKEWVVRFAPNEAGRWTWSTECSNEIDLGLHQRHGEFTAYIEDTDNPIHRHGFIGVDESRRGFMHEDGTPFFWLGDTAWAATAHAQPDEWADYVRYRSGQGYNIVQLNALPQCDASDYAYRHPFDQPAGAYDLGRLQPSYFKVMDELVREASLAGMICAIVILWYNYVPNARPAEVVERHCFDPRMADRFGRYLASRYAAYGCVWIISGDTDFQDEEVIAVYDAAAMGVEKASYYPAIKTAHLHGGTHTPDNLNAKEWLDFHMLQSCHVRHSAEIAMKYAELNRKYSPVRPVLNGEPCYDLLKVLDEKEKDTYFDRAAVRRVLWMSVLGGGNAGITYGAHGVWPWHQSGANYKYMEYGAPVPWREAMLLESGMDAARIKKSMGSIRWWLLEPLNGLLLEAEAENVNVIAAADPGRPVLIAYVSERTDIRVDGSMNTGIYSWVWLNPANGEEAAVHASPSGLRIESAPWTGDAVLRGILTLGT
ncbi:DUF4038 domain-containing protein [Cohnella suwonensis]|uniref:DUF4038 domain-containing protein n=1 Tax=Cohnella suwonensis TaxID=696072 RepID=A0ABW0M2M3_9BACL